MADTLRGTLLDAGPFRLVLSGCVGLASAVGVLAFCWDANPAAVLLAALAFALTSFAALRLHSVNKRTKVHAFLFGAVFVASQFAGRGVYDSHSLAASMPHSVLGALMLVVGVVGLVVGAGTVVAGLFDLIDRRCAARGEGGLLARKRAWLVVWAVLFCSWLVCLLALWPGSFGYDMPSQVRQIFTGAYAKHHPPLHTFVMAACFKASEVIGGALEPITVYALLQMLLISFALARATSVLASLRTPDWFLIAAAAFCAFNPVFALMAINPVKDSLFAAFFVLLITDVVKLITQDSQRMRCGAGDLVRFALFAIACCLLRNNFVYALALFAPFLLVGLWRCDGKRLFACTAVAVAVSLAISGPVYSAMGIANSSIKEAVAVPMQQIAKVVHDHGGELSDSDRKAIGATADYNRLNKRFNPRFTDPIKKAFVDASPGDVARLWVRLGMEYPLDYLTEFIDLNIPYWYIGSNYVDPVSERVYIESNIFASDYYHAQRASLIPPLQGFYEGVADQDGSWSLSPAWPLFTLSLPVWIVLACLALCNARGRNAGWLVCLLPLLFWLTYLVGPVSNLRYIFPLLCVYPLLLGVAFFPPMQVEDPSAKHAKGAS